MKLAIVGGRDFNNYMTMLDTYDKYIAWHPGLDEVEIISGGAKGADSLAKRMAEEYNLKYTEFPANWDEYGRIAGPIRNRQIVQACDMILAFWDGKSSGTADSLSHAKKMKKPTIVVYY